MRHRLKGRKLGRTTAHRQAMTRNLVTSLIIHGRVLTTVAKAKELRGAAEHLITLGKKGGLASFRAILDVVRDPRVAHKVVNDLAKRFADRPGGYTRVVKLGGCRWDGDGYGWYAATRLGDNGPRAIWEFVDRKDRPEEMALAGRGKLAAGPRRKGGAKGEEGGKKAGRKASEAKASST